jgi:hypothetical protein
LSYGATFRNLFLLELTQLVASGLLTILAAQTKPCN